MQFGSLLRWKRVCRLKTSMWLNSLPQKPSFTASLVDGIRRLLLTHKWEFQRKCESSAERHKTRLEFNPSSGSGRTDVECWPCHSGDSCLVLDYARTLTVGRDGAIGAQWYQALDPDSYGLTEDEEGFEIYWCRQNECKNYYGRAPGFSRIVREAEYHRSVDGYWSSVVI